MDVRIYTRWLMYAGLIIVCAACGVESVLPEAESAAQWVQGSPAPYPGAWPTHTPGPSPTRINHAPTETLLAQTVVPYPSPIVNQATAEAALVDVLTPHPISPPVYDGAVALTRGVLLTNPQPFMNLLWTTRWSETSPQHLETLLYAGSIGVEPETGVVRIEQIDWDQAGTPVYNTFTYVDDSAGPLTITDATSAYVVVEAADGAVYHFMIEPLSWVRQ